MEGLQISRCLHSPITRIVLSLAGAGVTYSIWMGIFVLVANFTDPIITGVLRIAAPIATALGVYVG